MEIQQIIEEFNKLSGNEKNVNKEQFRELMINLQKLGLRDLSEDPFLDELFTVFDTNHNGEVDLKEFVTGISLLCKGKPEEKLEITFSMWDENGDQTLDEKEMIRLMVTSYTNALKASTKKKFLLHARKTYFLVKKTFCGGFFADSDVQGQKEQRVY